MDKSEFDALESRVRVRADQMWQDAGSPKGNRDSFLQDARELVALEEVPLPTEDPYEPEIVEEASVQRNLGEFPTLRDQGDEEVFPSDDSYIPSTDGDASEQGGVLPTADLPIVDLPEISSGEADITSNWPEDDANLGEDDEDLDDINDDGLPDQPPIR
jgi:hypothetical protein